MRCDFLERKENSRLVWSAGNFYSIAVGDLSGNLFVLIFPTTDRGNEVKEDSSVKQFQSQLADILAKTCKVFFYPNAVTYHTNRK
jgi:hypothetical protein